MPAGYHGCSGFICTFQQCHSCWATNPAVLVQSLSVWTVHSASDSDWIHQECVSVHACNVFNPVNRKVLFSPVLIHVGRCCKSTFRRRQYLNSERDLLCWWSESHPPSLVIHQPPGATKLHNLFSYSRCQIILVQKVRQHFAMCMWKCLRRRLVWGLNPSDPPRSGIVGAPSPPQTPCRQLASPKGVSWQERSISSHVEEGLASKLSLEAKEL